MAAKTTDIAALRNEHAKRIREEALRLQEFAGYIIARIDSGHAGSVGLYAADIVAAGQRIMTGHATIQGLDMAARRHVGEATPASEANCPNCGQPVRPCTGLPGAQARLCAASAAASDGKPHAVHVGQRAYGHACDMPGNDGSGYVLTAEFPSAGDVADFDGE